MCMSQVAATLPPTAKTCRPSFPRICEEPFVCDVVDDLPLVFLRLGSREPWVVLVPAWARASLAEESLVAPAGFVSRRAVRWRAQRAASFHHGKFFSADLTACRFVVESSNRVTFRSKRPRTVVAFGPADGAIMIFATALSLDGARILQRHSDRVGDSSKGSLLRSFFYFSWMKVHEETKL